MAFLLGNESCIQSLRSDLNDIQETIDEILVRSGPVKCYSWKSPDKLASDLNIKDLIDRYKFGNDEVDNQVAHYSLLELIIDRLLLLIYISTNYVDQSSGSNENNSATSSKITRLSAGLAIKKFWSKFTQLCTAHRHLNCQNKSNLIKQKNSEDLLKSSSSSSRQSDRSVQKLSNGPVQPRTISEEVSSKCVQTNETAFVPCESCAKVQTNLKQNADQLINICHYQNLTSQVGKYRASLMANQLVGGWLNGSDLEKWLIEQDKDLNKIAKHLEYLSKQNELLKSKLNDNEAQITRMTANEKDLKKSLKEELETREITAKQYEKKLSDLKNDLQTKINNLELELKNLTQLKISLEQKNESLKNLYENNEKIVIELNDTNKVLTEELTTKTDQNSRVKFLEEEKLLLNRELECLKRELNDKTTDLKSERSKLENLLRTEQSLKFKHETTLESLDKVTADYETLKKKLDYVDEEKRQIMDSVKYKETTIENLKYESEILQNSISNLKLDLKKLKDNESLLIKYPDLYGPMDQLNDEELNVVDDMQNQINANKHRIHLLDNLNKKLIISIQKLNQTQLRPDNSHVNEIDANISNYSEDKHYFMKPPDSSSRAQSSSSTPKVVDKEKTSYTRPMPLFKLDNEIDEYEAKDSNEHENRGSQFSNKHWNQSESLIDRNKASTTKTRTQNDFRIDLEDEDDDDFLKDKRQSDQSYLDKLNQISQTCELKIENTDFSLMNKNSRRGSRDVHSQNSYLYSPSQSSMNSDSNSTQTPTNLSRAANYTAHNRFQLKTPPVPPAERNMEVIVGKGRRVNSASCSARSNLSATSNHNPSSVSSNANHKNLSKQDSNLSSRSKPPAPSRSNTNDKVSFKCDNCNKKYDDNKNLDIHKLYCNK